MKTIATFLNLLIMTIAVNCYSQKLNSPELDFEYACVSNTFNSFQVEFSFDERPFEKNNVFYVELSDQNGSFGNPTILQIVKDQNYSFEFISTLEFPNSVAGEGYQIRLRSTSPSMISPASAVFDAYFVNNSELILNQFNDVSLCDGSSVTIGLNIDVADEYVWYKNGEIYKLTQENSLAITEPGEYYVEPYYGNCTGSNYSNLVFAKSSEAFSVAISASKDTEDCAASNLTLTASVDNQNYNYAWFKNGEKIEGLSGCFPRVTLNKGIENVGTYHVEVTNQGGCKAVSNTYSFDQNKRTVVEVASPLNAVIIGDNKAKLAIKTDSSAGVITWYKDGQLLKEGYNSNTLLVADQGDYYAVVSGLSMCDGESKSQTFKIYEPISYKVQIGAGSNYDPCVTTQSKLTLSSIKGVLSNGDIITIAPEFYNNFQLQWLKGQEIVSTGSQLDLDYTENGAYKLQVSYEGELYDSNTVSMVMGLPNMELIIEKELSCASSKGILKLDSSIEGAVYSWYKDGALIATNDVNSLSVAKKGEYKVEVSYGGCNLTTASVTLDQNTQDLVEVYPGETATIGPNGLVQANASGAGSYKWISEQGTILSEVSTLNVVEPGVYTLFATVGSCVVEKTLTVDANLVENIPNVVSPNSDTVNDKWILPQKFINDPQTEVVICDAYGATILKTTDYDNSWPSSTTQFTAQTPVFYYFINKNGKNVKKGSITLVN